MKKADSRKWDYLTGTGLVMLAALLWGSSFAVRKMGLSDIGPLMQNAARFFVAFCFMLIVLFLRKYIKERKGISANDGNDALNVQIRNGLIIGTAFGLAAMFQQLGLTTVSAGETGFVTSLYTVLVPVLSYLCFRTKIAKNVWFGIILSFVGLYLVTGGNFSVHGGTMILFCGSIMYAVQIILIGKYIDRSDPLILVTVQVAVGTMVNLLMALITREQFQCTMLWNGMPVILYTGVFSLGVANLCQFAGQKKIPPSVTAIACSFESVFGLIFGMILLNEHMTILKLIGCLLIFAAVILSQCKDK